MSVKLEYRILTDFEKVFYDGNLNLEIPLTQNIPQVFEGLRGETIAFQIAFKCNRNTAIKLSNNSELSNHLTIREVQLVPCDLPTAEDDPFVLRKEPGLYPDPLCPMPNNIIRLPHDLWRAVWVSVRIPEDFKAGVYEIKWNFDFWEPEGSAWKRNYEIHERCTVKIKVHSAILPEQKLICTNWFYADCISVFYKEAPWTERFWEILENYFSDLATHGRNMLLTPLWCD